MSTQNKIDLANVKTTASVSGVSSATLVWNGSTVQLNETILKAVIVEGIYRQASMDSAKGGYTSDFEKDFIDRLSAGYLKESDRKKANKALTETKGGKSSRVPFSQTEIVMKARSMTKDKAVLATLDKVAAYTSEQFGLLLVKIADKPESLINRAIAELNTALADKTARELAAALEEIVEI